MGVSLYFFIDSNYILCVWNQWWKSIWFNKTLEKDKLELRGDETNVSIPVRLFLLTLKTYSKIC